MTLILETSVLRTDTGKRGKKARLPKLTFLPFGEQHVQQELRRIVQLSVMVVLCTHTHGSITHISHATTAVLPQLLCCQAYLLALWRAA